MKTFSCLVVVVVAVVVVATQGGAAPQRATKYTTKYDNIDVDRIIGNNRILTSYIKCMMDEGPCTAEGRELKKTLPDAIKSDCNGCNETQKKMAEKVITHLRTARSRDWDRLLKKFDPTGENKKRIEKAAAAQSSSTTVATPTQKVEVATTTKKEAVPSTYKPTTTTASINQPTEHKLVV